MKLDQPRTASSDFHYLRTVSTNRVLQNQLPAHSASLRVQTDTKHIMSQILWLQEFKKTNLFIYILIYIFIYLATMCVGQRTT